MRRTWRTKDRSAFVVQRIHTACVIVLMTMWNCVGHSQFDFVKGLNPSSFLSKKSTKIAVVVSMHSMNAATSSQFLYISFTFRGRVSTRRCSRQNIILFFSSCENSKSTNIRRLARANAKINLYIQFKSVGCRCTRKTHSMHSLGGNSCVLGLFRCCCCGNAISHKPCEMKYPDSKIEKVSAFVSSAPMASWLRRALQRAELACMQSIRLMYLNLASSMSSILIYKFEDSFDAATSSVRFDGAHPYILFLEYEVWEKKE